MRMRGLNISLLLLSTILLGTSCSDNDNQDDLENGTASLRISVQGQPTSAQGQQSPRSIGSSENNPRVESIVSNFTVFVFNFSTGDLEKSQSFTYAENNLTGEITDLSTGTRKHIVALVNVPDNITVANIQSYDDLNENLLTLQSQNADNQEELGLFMSGETTEALQLTEGTNTINIPVSRRVAKIILKSVIISSNSADVANFKLDEVSMQKVRVNGTPIGAILNPTDNNDVQNYAGGIASPSGANPSFNLTYEFLSDSLPYPADYVKGTDLITSTSEERYYYVLPNDGSNNNPTMLTLAGTYGNTASNAYFPFVINGTTGQGNTDGSHIQSNKIYEISVIINHPNSPSEDPNTLPSEGVLEVTITPQDWETTIDQNVEW